MIDRWIKRRDFYPRSPCGERQDTPSTSIPKPDFYPRSPCGERRNAHPDIRQPCAISIHALLAESDVKIMSVLNGLRHFYPRSPCGERPPVETINVGSHDFYPRSPCGERPRGGADRPQHRDISIHALLAESD